VKPERKFKQSCEGDPFSAKITDNVKAVFPKIGLFIPRLIEVEGDVKLDLRMFIQTDDGELRPTAKGIRFSYVNTMKLYKTLRKIKKLAETQDIFDLSEDGEEGEEAE
jgi:hypothetical protein